MASRSSASPAPLVRRDPGLGRHAVRAQDDARRFTAHQIDLVEHLELADLPRADAREHFAHLHDALIALRVARIDDVQQQVRLARFLQRRAKCRDQLVRQRAHESDRIREHHLAHAGELDAPDRRIQGREQLVGHIGVAAREAVEQGRFAGVGVADERHRRHRHLASHVPSGVALARELLEPARGACGCAWRSSGGRSRAVSRPVHAGRCRPSVARGGSSRAPGASTDATAARARLAACPRSCARAEKRCRESDHCDPKLDTR